jgi:hypothetical protein
VAGLVEAHPSNPPTASQEPRAPLGHHVPRHDGVRSNGGHGPWRGRGITPETAAARIERFILFANELTREHGRDHEFVPPDPAGSIVLSRFRQTVGWFINRLPGGRVALSIQYGHLQLTMAEGTAPAPART